MEEETHRGDEQLGTVGWPAINPTERATTVPHKKSPAVKRGFE